MLDQPITMGTANGQADCTKYCILCNIAFRELTYTTHCIKIKRYIIGGKIDYDVVTGRKFMRESKS